MPSLIELSRAALLRRVPFHARRTRARRTARYYEESEFVSRRRFFANPNDISGALVTLSPDETHHLVRVLRLKPGDEAFAFDGAGNEYRCRFASIIGETARLDIIEEVLQPVESSIDLTLGQSLIKSDKFELIIQKATELGVTRILPLITEYAEVRLTDDQVEKRLERWRRISLESMKQCGRRVLVEILAPVQMQSYLSSRTSRLNQVVTFSEAGGRTLIEAIASVNDRAPVTALIGPEGGWSADEQAFLNEIGCVPVSLGPRILRAETAAIVAVALLQHAVGDLSRSIAADRS